MSVSNQDIKRIEKSVLRIYKESSPSTYFIEKSEKVYKRREEYLQNLFLNRLHFPPKMFENAELLEFGSGTGENSLFFLKWGARCTFVEMNEVACRRAKNLFQIYNISENRYKLLNNSLFEFKDTKKYDIVVSNGVLQHTADKKRSFNHMSDHLSPGGFVVIGVTNKSGYFQRNLQRSILYSLSEDEDQIIYWAERLFAEHISRAEKFGGRDRKAIIYDSYINPKIDSPSISEVLSWFVENDLELYHCWPPIVPAILGDSAGQEILRYEKVLNLLSIPEIIYLTHQNDDIDTLEVLNRDTARIVKSLDNLVSSINDVSFGVPVNFDHILEKISVLEETIWSVDLYGHYLRIFNKFLKEVKDVIRLVGKGNEDMIFAKLKSTEILMNGTCGVGMGWYVAYKRDVT